MRFDASPALQRLLFGSSKHGVPTKAAECLGPHFRLPGETGLYPKTSTRRICVGSSDGVPVWRRRNQKPFESTGISRIVLGLPTEPPALLQVVALPVSSQGAPGRNCGTKAEDTRGKPSGRVHCLQGSEDTECAISSKEGANPSSHPNCQ